MFHSIKFVMSCFLLLCTGELFAQPGSVNTVAFTGDMVPGGGGETYSGFPQFFPVFNSNGTLTYHADTSAGDSVLISDNEVAVRTGEQVPGATPGTVVSFFEAAPFAGGVYISASYTGPDVDLTNDSGILLRQNDMTTSEVRSGDLAPGTSDVFGFQGSLRTTGNGDFTFSTQLQNSGDTALYARHDGTTTLLQRTGTTAPDGAVAQDISTSTTAKFNETDQAFISIFMVIYFNPSLPTERKELIQHETNGSDTVLVATGDSVPGLPIGTTIKDMFVPQVNNSGQLAMFADYNTLSSGSSVLALDLDKGAVAGGRSVAKIGDVATGLVDAQFASLLNFAQNSAGDVTFVADAIPTPPQLVENDHQPGAAPVRGIWYEDSTSTLQIAAYESMQAPGLDPGVGIFGLGFPAFNAQNQVVFKSALAGPGVEFFVNDQVLWATDPSGDLQLIARTGDLFDVDDDPNIEDLRTISVIGALENSAGTGGRATSFTDNGQLTMMLGFTDFTSGIFTFDLSSSTLSADFDLDGDVDGDDFLVWQRGGSPNGINSADLALWQLQYGNPPPLASSRSVPEPSGLRIIFFGFGLWCTSGWRWRLAEIPPL